MSASIIESKFQVLDRATKLLAAARHRGSKVSSQQLRDLVERERRRNTIGGGTSSATQRAATRPSRQKKESHSAREPTTTHIDSYPNASMAPERVAEYDGDPLDESERSTDIVGTAARRTHELRCRTWDEIEAAVTGIKQVAMHAHGQMEPATSPVSRTREQGHNGRDVNDIPHGARPTSRSLTIGDLGPSGETSAIKPSSKHTAPFAPSATNAASGKAGLRSGVVRCRSASRSTGGTKAVPSARNWFATPKTRPETGLSARKPCDQQHLKYCDCDDSGHDGEAVAGVTCSEAAERSDVSEDLDASHTSVIDQPSFYYLELRLDHPEPLATWRFQVTFTDLSAVATPPVTLDDLTVDDDNGLLFAVPGQNNSTSRFFNPVAHFRGVTRPRDLYDHVIKVLVRATHPVKRVVIDSLVHFTLSPSADRPGSPNTTQPPTSQVSDPLPLASLDTDQPQTPPGAFSAFAAASASPDSPPASRARAGHRSSAARRRRPSSPACVATDDRAWSPWDNPVDESDATMRRSPPRSPAAHRKRSPALAFRDELVGESLPTTDRKKMQLRQLRADVRRRMRQGAELTR